MKKYDVKIEIIKFVEVEAENKEEASKKVEEMFNNGKVDIMCDWDICNFKPNEVAE